MHSHKTKSLDLPAELNTVTDRDEYALAMFRLALLQGDARARRWVQHAYQEIALTWLRSHAQRDAACRLNNEDFYVSQAFEQLWQAASGQQNVAFATLAEALQYLRASLNSILLEALRASSRPAGLPATGRSAEPLEVRLFALLPDIREQRLAYLLYNCGLEPSEILRSCPQEFADLQEILRLRRKILARLLSNPDALGPWSGSGQLSL